MLAAESSVLLPIVAVEYREIDGFPGYAISDLGSVWSKKRRSIRRINPAVDKDGYRRVLLYRGSVSSRIKRLVHHLVLVAFCGERPCGHECRHLDGDPANNQAHNLSWGTGSANYEDRKRHGTDNAFERNGRSKMTFDLVGQCRNRVRCGETISSLARDAGVTVTAMRLAVRGKNWKNHPIPPVAGK